MNQKELTKTFMIILNLKNPLSSMVDIQLFQRCKGLNYTSVVCRVDWAAHKQLCGYFENTKTKGKIHKGKHRYILKSLFVSMFYSFVISIIK